MDDQSSGQLWGAHHQSRATDDVVIEPREFTAAPGYAFPYVDPASIELRFDESGSHGKSVSRIPERYVCLWPGCEVTCKRVYELKRHVNRHKPRRCWYCPVSGCEYASDFRDINRLWWGWLSRGAPAWTMEKSDRRTRLSTLLGFSRVDKLRNHLQNHHSEIYNDPEALESLMGSNPEPVAPIVLKIFRTDKLSDGADPDSIYHWDHITREGNYYIGEVTEVQGMPGQETVTASDPGVTQSYGIPAEIGETPPTPASGLVIDPLPAHEQNHLTPYLESQLDVTNAQNWVYPPDP